MPKAVLIGDSIRMGYQPHVAKQLEGQVEVWGPAENCRHSLWALEHFQSWVADQQPDVLHFNFGIHDVGLMADGKPQILLDQYCVSLERFIARARALGDVSLIWATTTPIYTPEDGVPMIGQWTKVEAIDEYNRAALEIVRREGIPVNDLHQLILDHDYTRCLTTDGVHMAKLGNELCIDAVSQAILAALKAGTPAG